jgi:hypothetical protein
MTALFASTAATVSGIGPVCQSTMDAAYAGRWLPAAADGADGERARSSGTADPSWDAGLLAPVLARHTGGRPARPADIGQRAGARWPLRSAD